MQSGVDAAWPSVGDDTIIGGEGDDVIFGDALFTDDVVANLIADGSYSRSCQLIPGLEPGLDGPFSRHLRLMQGSTGPGPTPSTISSNTRPNWPRRAPSSDPPEGREGGDDTLSGEDGNDTIFGQEGDDDISGGEDNDDLVGGTGADDIDR